MEKNRDLFISHASEDKVAFVRPLADFLRRTGCEIWFDEYELKPGDSLTQSIDRGIRESSFGLMILSKSFFGKHWTNEELRGFRAMEAARLSSIIPVWLGVTRDEVVNFSPIIADKFAIDASGKEIFSVGIEVVKIVKPKLLEFVKFNQDLIRSKDSKIVQVPAHNLKIGPIIHEVLSPHMISRIRLLQACLSDVDPSSLEVWIDNFSRDWHPHRELLWYEMFVTAFVRVNTSVGQYLSRKEIYSKLFHIFNSQEGMSYEEFFPESIPEEIRNQTVGIIDQFRGEHNFLFGSDSMDHNSINLAPEDR